MRKRSGCACRRRPSALRRCTNEWPFGVLGRLRCHRQLSRRGGRPSGNDAGRLSLCFCLSQGTSACAWLLSIARYKAGRLPGAGRPSAALSRWTTFPPAEPGYAAVEALELLRFLDEDEREVVILRVYTALPYKELAALLGITVPAAQKRYQRAMKTVM